ncbi:deoxyguanosinetriphosphate triphosphohydrolase family protein [Streptomyces sviceus]|uniref:deoxyguanosinetriphosphate triphosphohydrolase family protein n=1 Tax=Streptomyces sviceus TaxID=285530 RepID=UPI00381B0396
MNDALESGPAARRHTEEGKSRRSPFERDRDRLLYSSAFRRLAGVTQVAAVRELHLLHNRLTHSLKVAQVGRRLAQRLASASGLGTDDDEKNFPDVVEAAGLAHDIGHPPFGHVAETALIGKMAPYGGFEGNAQSFRVVTKLAIHQSVDTGLDLTRATLNAILKYPQYQDESSYVDLSTPWYDRKRGKKWGAYRSEMEDFEHARNGMPNGIRSPGAILMDWADDISYVVHDLHDYFRAGLVPLHSLRYEESSEYEEFMQFSDSWRKNHQYLRFSEQAFVDAYRGLAAIMPRRKWRDGRADRVDLDAVTRTLTVEFIEAVQSDGTGGIKIEVDAEYRVEVLKMLTFFYVIKRPSLAMSQEGQKAVIGTLFDDLLGIFAEHRKGGGKADIDHPVPFLLDDIYDGMVRNEARTGYKRPTETRLARAVCDFICTMTEDQAVNLYERITGNRASSGSMFGTWFN